MTHDHDTPDVQKYREACEDVRDAEDRARRTMRRSFPIGSRVFYEHGPNMCSVVVRGHGGYRYHDLLVTGPTGKEWLLDARRVDQCVRGGGR